MSKLILMISFYRQIPFSSEDLIVFKQLAEQMNCDAVKAYETDLENIKIVNSFETKEEK